jgi:hypothetical protein
MAKGNHDPTGNNDYLEQLQWRANHRRRVPVRFEPKWKYKIVYRYPQTTSTGRIFQFLTLLGVILATLYAVSAIVSSHLLELPGKIFIYFVFGLIITILFFAIQDGSEDQDKDNKDLDS